MTFPVSLANASSNATKDADLRDVYAKIIGPDLAALTAAVRSAATPEERSAAKRKLPGFIAAGRFLARRKDSWQRAAGLLIADVDHVADPAALRDQLAADPCVVVAFVSPSRTGTKCVLRVPLTAPDPEQHARAFAAATRWALEKHGVSLDPSGKDQSRLCFMCHDPAATFRPDAVPLDLLAWAPLPEIIPAKIQPVARVAPRHRATGNIRRRAQCYLATKPAAIQGCNGSAALYSAAVAIIHGLEMPVDDAVDLLMETYNPRCVPPWSEAEIRHKATDALTKPHNRPRGWLLAGKP
jgi:VirE N-terminal domain